MSFGDVCAPDHTWCELGFEALARVFHKARFTTAVEHAPRVMVFSRLHHADSKSSVLRRLQIPYMAGPAAAVFAQWRHLFLGLMAVPVNPAIAASGAGSGRAVGSSEEVLSTEESSS